MKILIGSKTVTKVNVLTRNIIIFLLWIVCGRLSSELGYYLGNVPFSFRDLIYYKINSLAILKLAYIFLELNLYKFVILFLTTFILSSITTRKSYLLIMLLITYNLPVFSTIYNILLTNQWVHLEHGSIEYYIVVPGTYAFLALNILAAILGSYFGTMMRSKIEQNRKQIKNS